jgi:hypothetical protein
MGSMIIVIFSPSGELLDGVRKTKEPVLVQALLAEPAVERLD